MDVTAKLFDQALSQSVKQASELVKKSIQRRRQRRAGQAALTTSTTDDSSEFLSTLDTAQVKKLQDFVNSPQFSHLILQTIANSISGNKETVNSEIRTQLRESLRLEGVLIGADLFTATEYIHNLIFDSTQSIDIVGPEQKIAPDIVKAAARIATAGAQNSVLLTRIQNLHSINEFADKLRNQVRSTHKKIRLASVIQTNPIQNSKIYVEPSFICNSDLTDGVDKKVDLHFLLTATPRVVICGDPGAGKSTLSGKAAYSLANDEYPEIQGQVPIVLRVREHMQVREEHKPLTEYLERSCQRPYGVTPPEDAIDYLLHYGRATVIIDGLDELGEAHHRELFVKIVENFANYYPLARILVTSREIGYHEASLDKEIFPVATVSPFSSKQVEQYAKSWFHHTSSDASLADIQETTRRFLQQSEAISDLRVNPLMLSLICMLFNSTGAIPGNRPEIYERCAELLFETWDQSRGLPVEYRYRKALKPSIQQVAWELFNDAKGRHAIPKMELINFLRDRVLLKKTGDIDEAHEAAEDFLRFCSGRAWVLTDMGSDKIGPHYGFVHRTFLEYFAASQLVRIHKSPAKVWKVLRTKVHDSKWHEVSELAVQILDTYVHDGGEEFLRLLLDHVEVRSNARSMNLQDFAIRCLNFTNPDYETVDRVTKLAVSEITRDTPTALTFSLSYHEIRLSQVTALSPDTVKDRVARSLTEQLKNLIENESNDAAAIIWANFLFFAHDDSDYNDHHEIRDQWNPYARVIIDALTQEPTPELVLRWKSRLERPDLDLLNKFGLRILAWSPCIPGTKVIELTITPVERLLQLTTQPNKHPHGDSDRIEAAKYLGRILPFLVETIDKPRIFDSQHHRASFDLHRVNLTSAMRFDPQARAAAFIILISFRWYDSPHRESNRPLHRLRRLLDTPVRSRKMAEKKDAVKYVRRWQLPEDILQLVLNKIEHGKIRNYSA